MITFLDENDVEHGALTTLKTTNAVNGERSISGEIISGDYVLGHIERGWRLRFEDEYYVITYAKPKDAGKQISVSFDAVHQFFWDFDKSSVHSQLKDGSHTFDAYLEFIFKDSGYRYIVDSLLKISAFSKQSFGYKKRLTLFNDIIKSTGVEFSVSGKVVRILAKAGTDLSTVVRKNFNLNELGIEKNIGDFVTYQKGFGAWNDSEDHSKGRLEVEYESPLASVYGRLEAEPLVDERYTNRNSMLSALKETVDNSYSISVKIDMEDLTKAGYDYTQPRAGDYIMAINETLGFREKIRIVSYVSEYDVKGTLVKHEVTCNDIGAVKKQSASYSAAKKQMQSTADNVNKALEVANRAIVSADGKNTVYFGVEFPKDEPKGTLKKGDSLYLQVGEETKMYFWNGAEWEEPPVVNDVKEFNRKLTQVEDQIETIAKTNQESAKKAQDALDGAGAVKDLAAEAKRVSEEAKQSATKALKDLLATGETLSSVKTEVEELDGAVKQRLTKVEVDELVNDKGYVSGKVFENYKSESAKAIERQLTETRALIPTEVGGENLLKNSLFAKNNQGSERFTVAGVTYVNKNVESWSNFYNTGIGNPTTSYHAYLNETFLAGTSVVEFNESNGTRNWKGISQKISPDKLISRDYHFSVDSYATGPGTKFWFGFYYFNKSGRRDFHAGTTTVIPTAVNQWQRLGGVIKLNDDVDTAKDILFYFYAYEFTSNAILYIKRPKLERGKIGTDHSLAMEDMVTEVDFNRVRETAQLYERIIGTTEGDVATKISRMAMTSELFMTEVGKALVSSENLVYDPTRYSKYQPRNGTSKPILARYTMYSAMRISHSGLTADQFNGFRLPLRTSTFTAGEKLSLRAVIGIDALPDSGGQIKFEIKNQGAIIAYFWLNPTRTGNNQVFTATTTVQVSTTSVDEYGLDILINRNGNVNITQISLVRGDTPPKSFVDNTSSQEVNLTTKMTQMSDSWAVRTLNNRGDVLSQINLAAGATSIEVGKNKLVITPETTYFQNGTIKSAMIESLDAGKIRTGRLDANLVDVINLNANNITSGRISGNMISGGVLSSINGETFFDLQNGYFGVNGEGVAIDNQFSGRPRQYLAFDTGIIDGVSGSYTALMSNRGNRIGFDNTSAGIQIWNGARGSNVKTAITLYGQSVDFLAHGGGIEGISIDSRGRIISGVNDVHIMGASLKSILDSIFDNFRNLANNENYSRGYYDNWR